MYLSCRLTNSIVRYNNFININHLCTTQKIVIYREHISKREQIVFLYKDFG